MPKTCSAAASAAAGSSGRTPQTRTGRAAGVSISRTMRPPVWAVAGQWTQCRRSPGRYSRTPRGSPTRASTRRASSPGRAVVDQADRVRGRRCAGRPAPGGAARRPPACSTTTGRRAPPLATSTAQRSSRPASAGHHAERDRPATPGDPLGPRGLERAEAERAARPPPRAPSALSTVASTGPALAAQRARRDDQRRGDQPDDQERRPAAPRGPGPTPTRCCGRRRPRPPG